MSAIEDFFAILEGTEVIEQITRSLREEPAKLLGDICREYQKGGQPVADHGLFLFGYLGESALKALISAGLINRRPGGRTSLYTYEPTEQGIEQYERLKADGFYTR
jgi:hypothetical protein